MDSTLTEQAAGGLSIFGLIFDASLTVQIVMLVLFLASAVSLYYIGVKYRVLRQEAALADQFED